MHNDPATPCLECNSRKPASAMPRRRHAPHSQQSTAALVLQSQIIQAFCTVFHHISRGLKIGKHRRHRYWLLVGSGNLHSRKTSVNACDPKHSSNPLYFCFKKRTEPSFHEPTHLDQHACPPLPLYLAPSYLLVLLTLYLSQSALSGK